MPPSTSPAAEHRGPQRSSGRPPAEPHDGAVAGTIRPGLAIGAERCSIAGALAALGDTWSILVLRELFFGVRRFNDLQADLGISRSVLADRLARLVELGVVRTAPYREPGDRVRHEYRLTRKGVGLLPVMVSLMTWGDEHVNDGDGPISLHHRASGEAVHLELRTRSGRIVEPNEIEPRLTGRPAT